MKYDFDRVIDRRSSGALKWAFNDVLFGDKDVLPLWVADMDFESPAEVVDVIQERAKHGIYGYVKRPAGYYDSFIQWMKTRHQWTIQPNWISSSPGVVAAINFIVQSFTEPGDKVIIQPPVYPPFFSCVKNNGRQLVQNYLIEKDGKYEMDFDGLEKSIDSRTRLMILCSPHNPVGRVWTKEELQRLGEICLKRNILIVADEIHHDLVYEGHPHTPIAAISDALAQNTITLAAPSKTFNIAGLSTSAVVIPNPALYARYNTALENLGVGGASVFGLIGFETAYRTGGEWLDQLLPYIQGNIDFVNDFLDERVPQIKANRPEGTYLMWLDCRGLGLTDAELNEFMLKKAKVALNNGAQFGHGGDGYLRLNLGCPRSTLEQALIQIEKAVRAR